MFSLRIVLTVAQFRRISANIQRSLRDRKRPATFRNHEGAHISARPAYMPSREEQICTVQGAQMGAHRLRWERNTGTYRCVLLRS